MDIDLVESANNTDMTAHDRSEQQKTHGGGENIDNLQLRKSDEETEADIKLVYEDSESNTTKKKAKSISPKKIIPPPIINQRPPRRVELITLSSPKGGKRK